MKVIAIIPARMGASRFPGKPMYDICGIPMIGHCLYRTQQSEALTETWVATCDTEIADYIQAIGGKVIMTSTSHTRATGRTAEAVAIIGKKTDRNIDVVIMVQGDEPLILPEDITSMIQHFEKPDVEIVNLMVRVKTRAQFEDKNNVKVVVNQNMDALYFSREPIPSLWKGEDQIPMLVQTGIIAFRREALLKFEEMPETILERIESVDMNRVLESGGKIRMIKTDGVMVGVDTKDEANVVAQLMVNDPIFKEYSHQ